MGKTFHVIISQDEDGIFVGQVPELSGCMSQGDTIDELMINIREAIDLCLEVGSSTESSPERFISVRALEVV